MAVLAIADIGQVTVVKGKAYVHRDKNAIKAKNAMALLTQDIVQTREGRLQMQFIDNTVISLGKNSRFRIREYLYQEGSTASTANFELSTGFIKTITGAISKLMPDNFVLHTKATKIISNGTIWSVMIDETSEEYKVIEGRITLSFNDGKEKSVSLNAGESMLLQIDSKNSKKVAKIIKKSFSAAAYEKELERNAAVINDERNINQGTTIDADGDIIGGNGNKGHGNDPDAFDPDNPGKKKF
jgi:hypothetical protein